jgi:hypothetical protein
MIPEVGCFTEKQVDMRTEHIYTEVADIVSLEPVLTQPGINQPPSTESSRPLKRTYAVAGQQNCSKHQEKTDCGPLDLTDSFTTIPRATKWTKFNNLDRMKKPGLSEAEFWGLFVKCDNCYKITTREVFRYHLEGCEGHQHEGDTDTDTDASESEQEI